MIRVQPEALTSPALSPRPQGGALAQLEPTTGAPGGGHSLLMGLWVGRGQPRGGRVTERQESPHLTPAPILQEQTTQAGDETAVTGECGWVQPPGLACMMPCRMDEMTDRGTKQRPLQTQVTKWSLFFSYFNFNEQGGPKG